MSEAANDDFAIFPPGITEEQKATFRRNVAKADVVTVIVNNSGVEHDVPRSETLFSDYLDGVLNESRPCR